MLGITYARNKNNIYIQTNMPMMKKKTFVYIALKIQNKYDIKKRKDENKKTHHKRKFLQKK